MMIVKIITILSFSQSSSCPCFSKLNVLDITKDLNLDTVDVGKEFLVKYDLYIEEFGAFSAINYYEKILNISAGAHLPRTPMLWLNGKKFVHVNNEVEGNGPKCSHTKFALMYTYSPLMFML